MSSQPPPPVSPLARYRFLSKLAGVPVSPLCLGGMSIGDKWQAGGMGSMNKESSMELLDAYFDAGGNFIDTASNYQDGSSEQIIGEWMEARGVRDQIVLATKYTMNFNQGQPGHKNPIAYLGNNAKALHISVEASLKKLRTSYIDLFYVHWWDYSSSIEEVMGHLHDLVAAKKILYLGISDTPAWVVSQANQWARDHGKTPFSVYQGPWNVMARDLERDIIPMARQWGMAIAPWNVLAGGKLRSDAEEQRRKDTGEKGRTMFTAGWERTEAEAKMSRALEKVAGEVGAKSITSVAIAYVMQKPGVPHVFPIIGGRKVEHLKANIEALQIVLSSEQIKYLESINEFDIGFPNNFIGTGEENNMFQNWVGNIDRVDYPHPILPKKN